MRRFDIRKVRHWFLAWESLLMTLLDTFHVQILDHREPSTGPTVHFRQPGVPSSPDALLAIAHYQGNQVRSLRTQISSHILLCSGYEAYPFQHLDTPHAI